MKLKYMITFLPEACCNTQLYWFVQHRCSMIPRQLRVFRRIVPNSEIVRITETRGQLRTELPELIHCHSRLTEHRRLPWSLDRSVIVTSGIGPAIFLQHDRLAVCFADGVMLFDPSRAPSIVIAPGRWVKMECSLSYISEMRIGTQERGYSHSPASQSRGF